MLILICIIALFIGLGEICWFAIKAAWGITKFAFSILFFPIIVIGMLIAGLAYLALPLLIIFAILGAFKCKVV